MARRVRSNLRATAIRRDKAVREEITKEIRSIGIDGEKKHDDVVDDWEHKPKFKTRPYVSKTVISMSVLATGEYKLIWLFVNKGTKPHVIAAVNAPYLVFQGGYSARTQPPAKAHVGTGTANDEWISAEVVNHPGSKGREFSKHILGELDRTFRRRIENAIRRGLRK